jgi:hypothetical protein
MNEYFVERTCKACRSIFKFSITKREAAFALWTTPDIWNLKCFHCGSTEIYSLGASSVELDKELLFEWAFDESLYVDEQDEEVILGNEKYVDILLDLIDNHSLPTRKRNIIIEAFCVVLHDYLTGDGQEVDENVAERVKQELVKRKQMVIESKEWIMGYIKEAVFPQLGLSLN